MTGGQPKKRKGRSKPEAKKSGTGEMSPDRISEPAQLYRDRYYIIVEYPAKYDGRTDDEPAWTPVTAVNGEQRAKIVLGALSNRFGGPGWEGFSFHCIPTSTWSAVDQIQTEACLSERIAMMRSGHVNESWPMFEMTRYASHCLKALPPTPPAPKTPAVAPSPERGEEYAAVVNLAIGVSAKKRVTVASTGEARALPDGLGHLLLRLVVELKQGSGGWVGIGDLINDGILTEAGTTQTISRLRECLAAVAPGVQRRLLIESSGDKRLRLSTSPDRVTCNRAGLLTHPNQRIVQLARRLPEKG